LGSHRLRGRLLRRVGELGPAFTHRRCGRPSDRCGGAGGRRSPEARLTCYRGVEGGLRSLAVIAVATVLPFWLLISLLWLGLKAGENVVCHCWADNRNAWQYSVQFIVALAGAAAWIAAVAAYVNSRRAEVAWLGLLASGATALWFVFVATG
jgi:hypothetical protein